MNPKPLCSSYLFTRPFTASASTIRKVAKHQCSAGLVQGEKQSCNAIEPLSTPVARPLESLIDPSMATCHNMPSRNRPTMHCSAVTCALRPGSYSSATAVGFGLITPHHYLFGRPRPLVSSNLHHKSAVQTRMIGHSPAFRGIASRKPSVPLHRKAHPL